MDATESNTLLPPIEDALRHFGRHLVALSFASQPCEESGEPFGNPDCHFFSGFVVQIRRRWFWATAGHILADIDATLASKKFLTKGFRLIDCFGTGPDANPIPFDYNASKRISHWSEDTGIDFGFVEISNHYRRLLEANGTLPIYKSDWSVQGNLDYEAFFMLGLPAFDHVKVVREYSDSYVVLGRPIPSAIYLNRLEDSVPTRERPYSRFVAELHTNSNYDIKGMSGGPIFGITTSSKQYRILAIQSAWVAEKKKTFGFFLSTAAAIAERQLAR